jgi:hypothetical protein
VLARGLAVGVIAMAAALSVFVAALVGPVEVADRVEGGLTSAVSGDLVDRSGAMAMILFPLVLGAAGAMAARALRLPRWAPAVPALLALLVAGVYLTPVRPSGMRWLYHWPLGAGVVLFALLASYPLLALVGGTRRRT